MGKVNLKHQELANASDILNTYLEDSHPRATEAAFWLEMTRTLPLTYAHPNLQLINLLGLYTYFSGSIVLSKKNNGINAAIHLPDTAPSELIELWKKELDLSFIEEENKLIFSHNGSKYARLLTHLGFHAHNNYSEEKSKAREGSQLPQYLTRPMGQYDSLDAASQKIAKQTAKNIVSAWFNSKSTISHNSSLSVKLMSQPSKDKLVAEARQMAQVMNIAYPQVNVTLQDNLREVKRTSSGSSIYEGRFQFGLDQLITFPRSGICPVTIKFGIEPNFAYSNKKKYL